MVDGFPLIQAFCCSLTGLKPKTVAAYQSTLRGLAAWMKTAPGGAIWGLDQLTETIVRSYMAWLAAEGRAPRTRQKTLVIINRFCGWAVDEGLLKRNPTAQIERPTVISGAPRELGEDQRFILKNLIENHHCARLDAIFALGYWSGLRISEVARLHLQECDANQRGGWLVVKDGKGGKSRTLDLHNQARRALYTYLYNSGERDKESPYVFTSQRSAWMCRQGRPDHITVRGIDFMWNKLKQQATYEQWSLIQDITFHDLRHDFAHRARAAGWTLEEIAVYLGHQKKDGTPAITTTARYTLPTRQQIKEKLRHLPG